MRFASAFSTNENLQLALDEACGAVVDEIDSSIDVAFVFFSMEYVNREAAGKGVPAEQLAAELASQLAQRLGTENIIGCCGESIVANQYELQWQTAISIWAGNLGKAQIEGCHLQYRNLGNDAAFQGWTDSLTGQWPDQSTVFAFADPFSFPMDLFLQRINEDREEVPVLGGIASGASQPGEARLILGRQVFDSGAVLLRISGELVIDAVVSQGCRPIGRPMVITSCERNEIHELGGRPALEQLQEIFQSLPVREQKMVNQGLHVGRVISEYTDRPQQGDFLIRNVVQIVEESGTIAIADYVRPGQTVQFQIRDHESAHAELKQLLSEAVAEADTTHQAALLFNCNGRGTRLFPVEHHDAALLRECCGAIPVAGFFAAGEIGPVGGSNFLHGFTSCIALFRKA